MNEESIIGFPDVSVSLSPSISPVSCVFPCRLLIISQGRAGVPKCEFVWQEELLESGTVYE